MNLSADEQPIYYSTVTRADGYLIRSNETYQIRKQNDQTCSSTYDIFAIERLWFDSNGVGQASGFYYRRPNDITNETQRKFHLRELIRCPSNQQIVPISAIQRPCHVLDVTTFVKGRPISEYTSRLTSMDIFVCEYRTDKYARTLTRLPKSKHMSINMKSYCFNNYLEKLPMKREYHVSRHELSRHGSYDIV
jgi:hypothetical protein